MKKIGIIGCGVIGGGFARYFANGNQLFLFDRNQDCTTQLSQNLGKSVQIAQSIDELISKTDFIILSVKPQHLSEVAQAISVNLKTTQLLISTLAGVSLERLQNCFSSVSILRIMPNLACFSGKGIIALVENSLINKDQKQEINHLFSKLGFKLWVDEKKIDALTALSASGPAFLFVIMEAMVDAGILIGLTAGESQNLVLEMFRGTIEMTKKTNKSFGEFKWEISSPLGTTIAGIREMEKQGIRTGIIETIMATYQRAKELA